MESKEEEGSVWKSVLMKFQKKIQGTKGGMQWSASRERERKRKIEMVFFFFFFFRFKLICAIGRRPWWQGNHFVLLHLPRFPWLVIALPLLFRFVVCECKKETLFTLCFLFFGCRESKYIIYIYINKEEEVVSKIGYRINGLYKLTIVDKIWMEKKERKFECFESFDR